MVYDSRPFPDLELGLVTWAGEQFPSATVGDELSPDYESYMPFIEISVESGPSDGLTWFAEVELAVFAQDSGSRSGRSIAHELATELCSRMGMYPRHFGGVVADTVEITEWPTRSNADEPDERTRCFSGRLTVSLRRK